MKFLRRALSEQPRSDDKGPLPDFVPLPRPAYFEMNAAVKRLAHPVGPGDTNFYPGPMVGAEALAAKFVASGSTYVRRAYELMRRLEPDDYVRYLIRYYETGLARFGENWGYADIVTVLLGLAEELAPEAYLEIGVRRGRSACAVGSVAPDCAMVLMDLWLKDYAGMDNPGPEHVRSELAGIGHRGPLEFLSGSSHETLPRYFADHPDTAIDLITVDGDHASLGAAQDLADVLPRLKIGGAIVFDDISHPKHPGLRGVWRRIVEDDHRFSSFAFDSVGFGVGFGIRKY